MAPFRKNFPEKSEQAEGKKLSFAEERELAMKERDKIHEKYHAIRVQEDKRTQKKNELARLRKQLPEVSEQEDGKKLTFAEERKRIMDKRDKEREEFERSQPQKSLKDFFGEDFPFSVKPKDGKVVIINSKGKEVSDTYWKLEVMTIKTKDGDIKTVVGEVSGYSCLLKIPENEDGYWYGSRNFHRIEFDKKLGLILVGAGAKQYILDPITGERASKGYHEIYKKDGKLYGRVGANEEVIKTPLFLTEKSKTNLIEAQKGESVPTEQKFLEK